MLASGIKILSEDDLQRIHDAAVKVLQQRGVWVEDEKLRQQLKQRGAGDGLKTDEVRLSRELVAECLQSAGRRPVLHLGPIGSYGDNRIFPYYV